MWLCIQNWQQDKRGLKMGSNLIQVQHTNSCSETITKKILLLETARMTERPPVFYSSNKTHAIPKQESYSQ